MELSYKMGGGGGRGGKGNCPTLKPKKQTLSILINAM